MANNENTQVAVDEGNDRAIFEVSSCGAKVGKGRTMAEVAVGKDSRAMVEV